MWQYLLRVDTLLLLNLDILAEMINGKSLGSIEDNFNIWGQPENLAF